MPKKMLAAAAGRACYWQDRSPLARMRPRCP